MKPALMAWRTRRMNDRLGLAGNSRITTQKINTFIADNNPNDRIRTFALNLHLDENQLAKKTDTSLGSTRRFIPWVAESILKNRSRIGKIITNPRLKKYRMQGDNSQEDGSEEKYASKAKSLIHDRILELMLKPASPKTGIVATLAYKFSLEKKLVQHKELQGINYQSYESPYFGGKQSKIHKTIFRVQRRILEKDDLLNQRCVAYYSNINETLMREKRDRYAHLFLDYCGTLGTNIDAINYVLKNKLVKRGGLIWITLCTRDRKGIRITQKLPQLLKKYSGEYKNEKLAKYSVGNRKDVGGFATIREKQGKSYWQYCGGDGRGKTMNTVIFRRMV